MRSRYKPAKTATGNPNGPQYPQKPHTYWNVGKELRPRGQPVTLPPFPHLTQPHSNPAEYKKGEKKKGKELWHRDASTTLHPPPHQECRKQITYQNQ